MPAAMHSARVSFHGAGGKRDDGSAQSAGGALRRAASVPLRFGIWQSISTRVEPALLQANATLAGRRRRSRPRQPRRSSIRRGDKLVDAVVFSQQHGEVRRRRGLYLRGLGGGRLRLGAAGERQLQGKRTAEAGEWIRPHSEPPNERGQRRLEMASPSPAPGMGHGGAAFRPGRTSPEQHFEVVGGDADARVGRHGWRAVRRAPARWATRTPPEGVNLMALLSRFEHDLPYARGVAHHKRGSFGRVEQAEFQAVFAGQRLHEPQHVFERFAQVEPDALDGAPGPPRSSRKSRTSFEDGEKALGGSREWRRRTRAGQAASRRRGAAPPCRGTPFMGVRISWLICARKRLLAWAADSAAFAGAFDFLARPLRSAVMSWNISSEPSTRCSGGWVETGATENVEPAIVARDGDGTAGAGVGAARRVRGWRAKISPSGRPIIVRRPTVEQALAGGH